MALIDLVKFGGNNTHLVWKFPSDELSTFTQLIVNESYEAVLYKEGRALDLFPAGRYTLSTDNLPVLSNLVNLPFGGKSPFTAEVWYVSKTHKLDVVWGTPSKIQLQDPQYRVIINVSAHGQFGFRITDARKLLVKLVGLSNALTVDDIRRYFKGILLTSIKEKISQYLIDKKISILEMNAHLSDLSAYMVERIKGHFEEYGVEVLNFYVYDISFQEDDPSVQRLRDALAKQAERDIFKIDYETERRFDTLNSAAANEGMGGGFASLGVGFGIGGIMKDMAKQDLNMQQQPPTPPMPQAPPAAAAPSLYDEIMKLKGLMDMGILTPEEFAAAKKKLIG